VELLTALALGAILLAGLLQIASSLSAGFRHQAEANALAESARFAWQSLRDEVEPAGYTPKPWMGAASPAVLDGSRDAVNARGDRLALERRSDRNCYGNPNPVLDANGAAAYFLLRSSFEVRPSGELAWVCDYGPDASSLVRQVNHLSIIAGVESFQLQYGVDADGDGTVDRWVRAGQWGEENRLRGVRFSLLLASPHPLGQSGGRLFQVLDETVSTPPDGRIRQVWHGVISFGGRET
jgi:hypothetical protein